MCLEVSEGPLFSKSSFRHPSNKSSKVIININRALFLCIPLTIEDAVGKSLRYFSSTAHDGNFQELLKQELIQYEVTDVLCNLWNNSIIMVWCGGLLTYLFAISRCFSFCHRHPFSLTRYIITNCPCFVTLWL